LLISYSLIYLVKNKKCIFFLHAEDKSSFEHLHMDKQKTVPPVPSPTTDDSTEGVEQLKKTRDRIERLVSDMGNAVDVILVSSHNDIQLQEAEETSYSKNEQYNKTVPNISTFDTTSEDFPIELNSNLLEVNGSMAEGKANSDKGMETEPVKEQEDRPVPPTSGTDDYLEYRADDSDRVYAVRNSADGELANDEDKDPDELFDGNSVQQNFSDDVMTVDPEEVAVESEIPAQLGDHTTEEVRVK
jgi:hypothetical protein